MKCRFDRVLASELAIQAFDATFDNERNDTAVAANLQNVYSIEAASLPLGLHLLASARTRCESLEIAKVRLGVRF